METPTAYDEVSYPGWPYPLSHPDHLAMLARLFGMAPADPARCRVLELGCGDGANLFPIALAWPQARVVGIDLAESAIARGRRAVEATGLGNLDLRCGDLASLPDDLGEFDYVIAHGVYSWVPEAVRRALLAACRRHLAPQGVAFVSYNVLPGGHLRRMLREMLLMHVEGIDAPQERCAAAREFLAWVSMAQPEAPAGAGRSALAQEAERLSKRPDSSLFHDDLSDEFHLCYFRDFCAEADAHGLQFLAEAEFFEMQDQDLPKAARERLDAFAPDLVAREQYLDFLKERRFRQTLLCRADVELRSEIRGDAIWELSLSSAAQPEGREVDPLSREEQHYRSRRGNLFSTNQPLLKTALALLRREWPRAMAAEELLQVATAGCSQPAGPEQRNLLANLALACFASGSLDLHARQAPFARWPGARPTASPLARLQAQGGRSVTNLLGATVELDDPLAARLLPLLDGSRDRAALLAAIRGDAAAAAELRAAANGNTDARSLAQALDRCLDGIGRCALLLPEHRHP